MYFRKSEYKARESKCLNGFIYVLIIFNSLFTSGCRKFIQVESPPTELMEERIFESDATAQSAIVGLYTKMNNSTGNMFCGGISLFSGLASDELINTTASTTYDPYQQNSLLASTSTLQSRFWANAYSIIYQANAILGGIQKSTGMSDSIKGQFSAEARLVRALVYFNLVQYFGDLPFVTGTDYSINSNLPRTGTGFILEQIETDLRDAILHLPAAPINNNARPNSWAARNLLARLLLYRENWEEAEREATAIIENSPYILVTGMNNVFLLNSQEILWKMLFVSNSVSINSPEGNFFIPSSSGSRPGFVLSPSLLSGFEPNDQRKTAWTKTVVINNQSYTYPYKYKVRSANTITEANIVFRKAEAYLIRAEARLRQGNTDGAKQDINRIRNRAGLPNTSANTVDEVSTAIVQERRIEFFAEWGHRWMDLKRWQLLEAVMTAQKPGLWQEYDRLWPIPFNEITLNAFLVQNPGY
ncbi:MAG: RagB/SusD family nutrient uptake outer membrane protein [Sphingobacteriales bacterium]|nr:RagB/SusD family nutrient uptake outer membrane protein [Sphingobacteriales bacterium]